MPKMRHKQAALKAIFKAAQKLMKLAEEKGLTEFDVGRGELRDLLNPQTKSGKKRRGKDCLTMAIQRFTSGDHIVTPTWMIIIKDASKPVIHFKALKTKKSKRRG